jgi:ABC-2 type transport system permease protein
MRVLLIIIQKEFKQIFRNRGMLPIIFVLPIIQLLILANAATFDIKNIKIRIVDKDLSSESRRLVSKFEGSPYFLVEKWSLSSFNNEYDLDVGTVDLILEIPNHFGRDLYETGFSSVQLLVNAIDGIKAGLGTNYAQSVMVDFLGEFGATAPGSKIAKPIEIIPANWYNEELNYKEFMVPGILVLLVTMIGAFLTSMNIVREKEIGTIEQLNVTPIHKTQFILGKLAPFWVLGLFVFGFGLLVGKILYDIPIEGSLWVLFAFAGVYLFTVLGIGLFVSTVTNTQQQAMFISWFFLVIFILMSGLFTAIENMPMWAQKITYFNPVRYFMEVVRLVLLKGAGFKEVQSHFVIMAVFSTAVISLAVLRYRKSSG